MKRRIRGLLTILRLRDVALHIADVVDETVFLTEGFRNRLEEMMAECVETAARIEAHVDDKD